MSKTRGLILTDEWTQKGSHPNIHVFGTSGDGKGFVLP